jgi:glycosyltransferase 2 family protein
VYGTRALGDSGLRMATFGLAAVLATVGLVFAGAGGSFGRTFARGLSELRVADGRWLWVAALGFAGSLAATAGAWRSAITACGGRVGRADACARYGVGSLVNTFLPARLGDAVRVGLFSRAFPQERAGRTMTAVGTLGAVSAAEALSQSGVLGSAVAVGAVPLWSAGVVVGVGTLAAALAFALARHARAGRFARVLDVVRSMADSPRRALRLVAWASAATTCRLLAAVAIASSFGIRGSLEAGLVMCAVLTLATAIPLTPGNLGVTSGAIAFVLHARGVPLASALAAGVAFHAVEIAAGIAFGVGGMLFVSRYPSAGVRRWSLGITSVLGGALLVAGVGATFVPQLH